MWSSTIPFSCARFMMLSLYGARQISGNSVTMSIFIEKETSNAQHPTSNAEIVATVCDRRLETGAHGAPLQKFILQFLKLPAGHGARQNWPATRE